MSSGTRIFYSGVESKSFWEIAAKHSKNFLMSFYYLKDKGDFLKQRKEEDGTRQFMIDSGAHTLNQELRTRDYYKEYLKEYSEWLDKNREYIYCAVELDVGNVVGMPIVHNWREKYFTPLEKEGMQIIYVWHKYIGLNEWEPMCRQYRYVGFSNDAFKSQEAPTLMITARRYRTRVHGFAVTGYRAIRDYTMFTADSTTWLTKGAKYGEWYLWLGDKLKLVAHKEDRPKYEALIRSQGFDYDAMCKEDYRLNAECNIFNFRLMEEFYASRRTHLVDNWDIRVPYPELIAKLSAENVQDWLDFLELDGGEVPHTTLMAVSCLLNSRLTDYMGNNAVYDEILTRLMGGLLMEITDDASLGRVRDAFSATYTQTERIKARNIAALMEPDTAKVPIMRDNEFADEDDNDYEMETLKGDQHEDDQEQEDEERSEGSEADRKED